MSDKRWDENTDLLEKTRDEVKEPPRYTVVLHNDNFTTQEFVVWVLIKVFQLSQEESFKIMMDVHKKGKGSVGKSYTSDIARTKAKTVEALAKENEYPLKCTVEPLG